jgi:hypothetical protein
LRFTHPKAIEAGLEAAFDSIHLFSDFSRFICPNSPCCERHRNADMERYKMDLFRYEFDRVTIAKSNDFGGTCRLLPIVWSENYWNPVEPLLCCNDAIPIHRIAGPCCCPEVLFYTDINITEILEAKDSNAPALLNQMIKTNMHEHGKNEVLTMSSRPGKKGHWTEKMLFSKIFRHSHVSHIVAEYIPKRILAALMAPMFRSVCEAPGHDARLDHEDRGAFEVEGGGRRYNAKYPDMKPIPISPHLRLGFKKGMKIVYLKKWKRVAALADLHQFNHAHVEDERTILNVYTKLRKQLSNSLLQASGAMSRMQRLSSALMNPDQVTAHYTAHVEYFEALKFIMDYCTNADAIIGPLPTHPLASHNLHRPGVSGKYRRARVIENIKNLVESVYFYVLAPVQHPLETHLYTSKYSQRPLYAENANRTVAQRIQHEHGTFSSVLNTKETDFFVCRNCPGTVSEWNALEVWFDCVRSDDDEKTVAYSPVDHDAENEFYGPLTQELSDTDTDTEAAEARVEALIRQQQNQDHEEDHEPGEIIQVFETPPRHPRLGAPVPIRVRRHASPLPRWAFGSAASDTEENDPARCERKFPDLPEVLAQSQTQVIDLTGDDMTDDDADWNKENIDAAREAALVAHENAMASVHFNMRMDGI